MVVNQPTGRSTGPHRSLASLAKGIRGFITATVERVCSDIPQLELRISAFEIRFGSISLVGACPELNDATDYVSRACMLPLTDPRMPTVPNTRWAPSRSHHQEWSALSKNHPGVALQQQQLGAPANVLPEVGSTLSLSSLRTCPTPTLPAQSTAKNILALVTAADHSNAPVLEFRLQSDDDALMACHRVQAFVFNQVRHCPAPPPPCFPP